ncbi:MAG: hypothetical protein N3F63_00335 [Thermoplasmata archaeon]|nr:hypothetical protein [Thermoplasmata archaeon]
MSEQNEQKEKKIQIEMDREKDVEELERVLAVVSEKVPALLNALTDVLYGKEQSKKYAEAVATFYKSLVEAGMDKSQAYELTKDYMANLNIAGAIGKLIKEGKEDEIGEEIEKAVKEKIKEKVRKEREEEK